MLFMVYYVIAYYTFAKGDPSVMAKQSRKKRSPGRRILLLLLLVLLAAGFFRWSNHSLQVERFTFTSPRLPQGFAGCTIVELSDLHGAQFGEGNQDLIDEIRELSPDYIFLTAMGSQEAAEAYIDDLFAQDGWRQLTAVAEGNYQFLPREMFHFKPNARWGEAYAYLAQLLYPDLTLS